MLVTKNENLGASWPKYFFLKVEHWKVLELSLVLKVRIFGMRKWPIRHLHISHNAPYLLPSPPPILHNLCFSFPLGITGVRREIENNAYAKFRGVNKVHYR